MQVSEMAHGLLMTSFFFISLHMQNLYPHILDKFADLAEMEGLHCCMLETLIYKK